MNQGQHASVSRKFGLVYLSDLFKKAMRFVLRSQQRVVARLTTVL
jgi:hypothetical protein